MFRLHWGDCKDDIETMTMIESKNKLQLDLDALQRRNDRQSKMLKDYMAQIDKLKKQLCNIESYSKELEMRLSYVKNFDPIEQQTVQTYPGKRKGTKRKKSLLAELLK